MEGLKHYLKEVDNIALAILQLSQDNRCNIKGTTTYMRMLGLKRKLKYLISRVKSYGKKPIKKVTFNLTKEGEGINITHKYETYFVDISNSDIKLSLDIHAVSKGYKVEILEILDIPTHIRQI